MTDWQDEYNARRLLGWTGIGAVCPVFKAGERGHWSDDFWCGVCGLPRSWHAEEFRDDRVREGP